MIGARTAFILYAVLIAVALATLKEKMLALALLIILALAAKTYVDYMRRRSE